MRPIWDTLERRWQHEGEGSTLAYTLPPLCNLCQLPTLFMRPGKNTACTREVGGRKYVFCSEPCRWIFDQELSRFAGHTSVVDRIVAGVTPGNLPDLLQWMGLQAPDENRQGPSPRSRPMAARAGAEGLKMSAVVYLFGFMSDDFIGRFLVTPSDQTVETAGRTTGVVGMESREPAVRTE